MSNEISDLVNSIPACIICEEPFREGDKKSEAPCCGRVAHTQCMILLIANSASRWNDAICICGQTVYLVRNNDYHINRVADNAANVAILEERKKNPVYKADFKRLKTAISSDAKAATAFHKLLSEKRRQFNEEVNTSINIIKTAKQEMIDGVKSSVEFKAFRSARARQSSLYNRFMRVHQLNGTEMRGVFPNRGRNSWRYRRSGASLISGYFRIRI